MKTSASIIFALLLLVTGYKSASAQTKGDGNVITQERQVSSFDAIKVNCAINLILSQGNQQSVNVETDANLQNRVITKVSNNTLNLECNNVHNATKLNVYVTATTLNSLDVSGAAKVTGQTPIKSTSFGLFASGAGKAIMQIETSEFINKISGAASVNLTLNAKTIKSEISGAGSVILKGSADSHKTEVSGAGNLKALEFITDKTDAEVSGAGNAQIMARKVLKANLSGAGNISYFDKDNIKKINKQGEYQITFDGMENVKNVILDNEESNDENESAWTFDNDDDSVTIVLDNKKVVVVTDDSVRVNIGQRDVVITEDGVKVNKHNKQPKFNGHWAGFELGVNGLLNSDMKIDYPAGYEFMDLNYAKSTAVSINLFEQNINLANQKLGLVTGLGLTWNNYRFAKKNTILTDDGSFDGKFDNDPTRTYEKSKLVVTYLKVPLMLEFQTNSKMKSNSFHIGAGVVGGLRIGSHTKIVYDGNRSKDKGDFYINPFKVDAIAKIGWGVINLYGTYALTEMFRTNKGPEIYPFEIGISLLAF